MDDSEYNFRRQRSWDSVRFARRYHNSSGGSRTHLQDRLAESDESIAKMSGSGCSTSTFNSAMQHVHAKMLL